MTDSRETMVERGDFVPSQNFLHRVHSQQRAKERFGVDLTDADYNDMAHQCERQAGICIGRKPGAKKARVWLVWWPSAKRIVPIYYHKGRVLSVLPTQYVSRYLAEQPAIDAALQEHNG